MIKRPAQLARKGCLSDITSFGQEEIQGVR